MSLDSPKKVLQRIAIEFAGAEYIGRLEAIANAAKTLVADPQLQEMEGADELKEALIALENLPDKILVEV